MQVSSLSPRVSPSNAKPSATANARSGKVSFTFLGDESLPLSLFKALSHDEFTSQNNEIRSVEFLRQNGETFLDFIGQNPKKELDVANAYLMALKAILTKKAETPSDKPHLLS